MSHQPVDKRGSTETDQPGLSLRESASASLGGLSRAALHTLKDAWRNAATSSSEAAKREPAAVIVGLLSLQAMVFAGCADQLNALLTAPSSRQEGAEMHATSAEIDLEIEQMRLAACMTAALDQSRVDSQRSLRPWGSTASKRGR